MLMTELKTAQSDSIDPVALKGRQVAEAFAYAFPASWYSYFGAVLTLLLLIQTGDATAGAYWFVGASVVLIFRVLVVRQYRKSLPGGGNPLRWEQLLSIGNFFAGLQWGALGLFFFNTPDLFRQMFILMVIVSYVAGAIVPFAALRWTHLCLTLPASIPTIVYAFFLYRGPQWLPGTMALFFMWAVAYFGFKQHQSIVARLRLQLQNEALLAKLSANNMQLGDENIQLREHTQVVARAGEQARRQAEVLASHLEQTLLPVIECDPSLGIIEWNSAAEALLGYRADEVRGNNMGLLLFPQERQGNINTFLEKLFRDRQPMMIEFPAVTKFGERVPVRYYVTPIFSADGGSLRISVIITESYFETDKRRSARAASN
jgi:PAS domain S-box-containing protein